MKRKYCIAALALVSLLIQPADVQGADKRPKKEAVKEKSDTTAVSKKKGYDQILKGAVTDKGMFDIHRVGTDYYFEIPDSLMGRDMLIVNKISGVPYVLNDAGVNKGMESESKMIRFYKDTLQKKVWVVTFDPRITSPQGDAITKSVKDNYREAVIEQFSIEASGKDSMSVVIKVNKVFDGSEKSFNNTFAVLSLSGSVKKELSKITSLKAFPKNIVAKSVLTTSHTEENRTVPISIDATVNIVLLDKEPMIARFADSRVGFFATGHLYFNDNQQKAEERELVNRWRLEPKSEDVERYLKGELVEPAKPIVFYIDPATPPVWIDYIKKGVFEWQVAFEAAGFKNAIIAKEVDPVADKDFDIDDVRYSVITYAASEKANAMGPSIMDPRSGEIIEADVIWWHNVMSLLHAWIRVQTGAVDVNARGNVLPTELLGNAVRFVSSHELGHSLGIKHNMGASFSVPVDSLRSKTYTSANGTASSIMDYARFNYVAQPEDGITELTPRIGTYDKFAIGWAYRWLNKKTPHQELSTLNKWIREKENDIDYWYGEQSSEGIDPRSQSEDLGNDAIMASRYGLANLKRILPEIMNWTAQEGELQGEAGKLLTAIVSQWQLYANHVKTNIGGFYINNVVGGASGDRYIPVDADYQRKCVDYLIKEVFITPSWLFDADVWNKTYSGKMTPIGYIEYAPYSLARASQYNVYYDLLRDERLLRMYESETRLGREKSYTPEQMLSDISTAVFVKPGKRALSIAERMSQKNYIDALIVSSNATMVKTTKKGSLSDQYCTLMYQAPDIELENIPRPEDLNTGLRTSRHYDYMHRVSETTSAKRGELRSLLYMIQNRLATEDTATRNHYYDLVMRIKEALSLEN